ncbi:MAG TPA: alkaline phosphatase family protein [Candidatus Cybelea sp.]|nr:alkaline phosphatase family protein [Candidatus Cybelea sp.]
MRPIYLCAAPLSVLFFLAGCGGNGIGSIAPARDDAAVARRGTSSGSPIKHVIFIIQENRSFNNFFMGYPGAKTQKYGYDNLGDKIPLHAQDLPQSWDIEHFSPAYFEACDGKGKLPGTNCKNDGWNQLKAGFDSPKNAPYAYVPHKQIQPYWDMAKQYVLADRMFASNLDGSFISHQYAVAAFASSAVDYPGSYWGCPGGPPDVLQTLTKKRTYGPDVVACFNNPTIGSEADTAGVSWRFYAGSIYGDGALWNAYQADSPIYNGPDWNTDVISPPSQFLTDIGNGYLAGITWITPTYEDSDHAGLNSSTGPAWVASLVDAIGSSKFWSSSAIFIMWDDWGGWFDPVKPVFKDYDGLGYRVPLIVVSPYARKGYVTHVQYETASVLRFMEDNFGLSPLAASDERAADPAGDALDYGQTPRKFKKIRGSKTKQFWARRAVEWQDRGKPAGFIGDD